MSRVAVVLTTINLPEVLSLYYENARKYAQEDIFYVIIGDRKSPSQTAAYIQQISQGQECYYLGIAEQEEWLKPFPRLAQLLPYDSVQRRNIGYLYACQRGAEVIISIDDDNLPLPEYDYFGQHRLVGSQVSGPMLHSSSGWFNSCSLLESTPHREIYHRGFPVKKRWQAEEISSQPGQGQLWVNVGLWLEDPDVDTVTRLEQPLSVTGVQQPELRRLLAPGMWAPFNSQNTAFSSQLLPAMFLITLNHSHLGVLRGNNNFRYDDIWMSYFVKAVADRLGGLVAVGPPHVRQQRNPHDLLLDLEKELFPMRLTNYFPELLPTLHLTGSDAAQCYGQIADQLYLVASQLGCSEDELAVFSETAEGMHIWLEAVEQLVS